MLSKTLLSLLVVALEPVSALWPAPQQLSTGTTPLYIHQNLEITYNGGSLVYTHGFEPGSCHDSKQVVQGGVSRALSAIFQDNFVPWKLHKANTLSSFEPNLQKGQNWIKSLAITQSGTDTEKTFKPAAGDVDESYSLTISTDGAVKIGAVSSIGVLRALESFVQLFYKHSGGPFWYTPYAPVSITDAPKFPHRGVLLDIARQWYEVEDVLHVIDAMSWNKMNRLHIHITDSQSWPLEITSMPEVAQKGAYRSDLTYDPADVKKIHEYGVARGVEVILEIDMPGHIGSLVHSHPELIVAYDGFPYYHWCAQPPCGAFKLNDTRVDAFLEKLFDDILPRISPYTAYFHTGGDELKANDSRLDEGVRTNNTEVLQPLLQKFISAQHDRVRKHGLAPMVWEEMPLDWNITLGKDTVVQTWLSDQSVKSVTALGLKVIDSNYNYWYLDCGRGQWILWDNGEAFESGYPFTDWCGPTKSWGLIYSHDPTANLTADEAKLVLGGEVAVWSETIDAMNLDTLLWPRASAAGEVLWSGRTDASGQNRSQLEAAPRLNEWRERMVARGVRASPIYQLWCAQSENSTLCSSPTGPGY